MKSFARYLGTITFTAVATIALAIWLLGTPASADPAKGSGGPVPADMHDAPKPDKQTAPQPAASSEPQAPVSGSTGNGSTIAPPVVKQADKGAAASPDLRDTDNSHPPSAPTPGSAAGGGPGDGSAAAAAGAGSAAPAPAGAPAAGAPAPKAEMPWYEKLVNRPTMDLDGGNFFMPKSVNVEADGSDLMFVTVLGLSIFFFVAIAIAVIYLTVKYRHRPGHKAEPSSSHNDALEVTWTVIPTLITVFLFYYGWRSYIHIVTPPTKAVEINVVAKRWSWEFTHSNGTTDSNLHVPVNTPVRLVMTSTDVLHSFYVPVFRTKQDIIPRRYTYAWFQATKPGTYRLNCAEYCGTNHSQMGITAPSPEWPNGRRAVVVVHEPGGYERYLADTAAGNSTDPVKLGASLYEKKGCNGCHTTDGTPRVGPSFQHDFGTKVKLSDGSTVDMDENYIRESLMYPQAKARPGFPPSMPSFEGQLKEKEILGLIEFIKSLK